MKITEIITEGTKFEFNGRRFEMTDTPDPQYKSNLNVWALDDRGTRMGIAKFQHANKQMVPMWINVSEQFIGKGVMKSIFDALTNKGYTIFRSDDESTHGRNFWNTYQGIGGHGQIWKYKNEDH